MLYNLFTYWQIRQRKHDVADVLSLHLYIIDDINFFTFFILVTFFYVFRPLIIFCHFFYFKNVKCKV